MQEKPFDPDEINALLQSLQEQRNTALNEAAQWRAKALMFEKAMNECKEQAKAPDIQVPKPKREGKKPNGDDKHIE